MAPIGWASECCGLVRRGVHHYGIGAVAVFLLAGAGMKATSAAQGHNEAMHSANTLRPLTGAFPSSMATSRGDATHLSRMRRPACIRKVRSWTYCLSPCDTSTRSASLLRVTSGAVVLDGRRRSRGPGGSALTGRTEGSAPTLCLYASSLTLRRRERASGLPWMEFRWWHTRSSFLVSTSPGFWSTVACGTQR